MSDPIFLRYSNSKSIKIWLHGLIWIILFSLPYLLSSGELSNIDGLIQHSWLPLVYYAVIFYLNYIILIKQFLFKNKIFSFCTVNLALIAFFIFLNWEIRDLFFRIPPPNMPKMPVGMKFPFSMLIYKDLFSLIIPVALSITLRMAEHWVKLESEKKENEKEKLQTALQLLKYQLQPHFFFNSLNNIYSLVDTAPDKAKETLHSLSKLMRYLLYDANKEKVELIDEVDFVKKYIELMRMRLTVNTLVKVEFFEVPSGISVAPLLFISLIENAFKHGVSSYQSTEIQFIFKVQDNTLFFTAVNDNLPKNREDFSGSGIGLANLTKRLDLLYPNRYSFSTNIENNKFFASLFIMLNQE